MRLTKRTWAALALTIAAVTVLPPVHGTSSSGSAGATTTPGFGAAPVDATPLANGLPPFPSNLTHFVYIVRENHVFDDYLGDCHSTINESCNDNQDYTSQTNHIADVPFLHQWAQTGSVFDNMYSSVDPYSAQAHSFLLAADTNTNGGINGCSTTVQGNGPSTEWGVYNGSSAKSGYCGWYPDGSQDYPSDGSVFDRFTGPNVKQSGGPLPYLIDGDIIWELDSPGCSVASSTGIPGPYPHDSVAVEHLTCTGSQGWWTNTTSGAVNPIPPVTNPATNIPDMLFVCQDACSALKPIADQDLAYGFVSYVADYGLPTYTYIRLPDDHPGPQCPGGVSYDVCIQWNDQSMNLILEDIFNGTSTYRNNTVVAISEDDTQDGQNGPDHVNNGRRFPFVLVAPPNVMKTGNPNPASCGLTSGTCGNVVHPTFNTSNVLAVMERVEMNVNPSIFSSQLTKVTFPMQVDDQLAEGNPLEPVWRCLDPRVPCATGTGTPVLTTTSISPNPAATTPGRSVVLTATALDQGGNSISGTTFAWSLNPPSLGSLTSPGPGSTTTWNAATSVGTGNICENATYSGRTLLACVPASIVSSITLASATVSPQGPSVQAGGTANLHASAATSAGGKVYPPSATFQWTLSNAALGTLNSSSGTTDVAFAAGTTLGTEVVCVNVTWSGTTQMGCSAVTITSAAPALKSGTETPTTITLAAQATQQFWAQGIDQFGRPLSGCSYTWSLSSASLGTLSTTGTGNTTTLTAGSTAGTWKVSVMITHGFDRPVPLNATVTVSAPNPLSVSASESTSTGNAPLSVTFTGTVSGGTAPYSDVWNFGNGATQTQSGATPSFTYSYTASGTFTPTLGVTDAASHTQTYTLPSVVVSGGGGSGPGNPTATISPSPTSGTAPLTVNFVGGAAGGTPPYHWSWSFGGGGAASTQNTSFVFHTAGTYTVFLNVTDAAAKVGHATITITVAPPSSTKSNPSSAGLLGIPWLLWGLLIAAVAAAALLMAVALRKRRGPPEVGPPSAWAGAEEVPSGPPPEEPAPPG
ncbi:MAG: PKD domain-containing protein [Euryarchaeota archaeon]|nr:PKD domain-containing protein [Euryarchaeota archaeon]